MVTLILCMWANSYLYPKFLFQQNIFIFPILLDNFHAEGAVVGEWGGAQLPVGVLADSKNCKILLP
jgi:hypothetical protein